MTVLILSEQQFQLTCEGSLIGITKSKCCVDTMEINLINYIELDCYNYLIWVN